MNALDKFAPLLSLTREPFPASTNTAIAGSRADLRVPVRDVALTNGEIVSLYDTSGPYTDPAVDIDVRRGLPDVLDPLTPTQVRDVPAPDQGLLASPVVTQVRGSVVQISGIASSCSRQIDGSGFVYADERVMTNAHVLAGVTSPTVNAEGESYDAVPVFVDEETDVAVLAVPGLPQVPLTFAAQPADSGADAIIMGYPGGGGLYVGPARVRDRGDISGPDFRASQTVVRDVYALFGQVRAGNSGGPLLATDGTVLGVVFASAIDDPDTGYALTGAQVAEAAAAGSTARTPVDTGPCE